MLARAEQERWSLINRTVDNAYRSRVSTADVRPRTDRRRWTDREIALATEEDLTAEEVAFRVGRSVKAVEALRRRFAHRHNHVHRRRQLNTFS